VPHPREKAGVFAVRQGPILEENLRRVLAGKEPRSFRPQKRFLTIISTGDRYAVASRGPWKVEGRWVWRWKDRIDRKFMARYRELPFMEEGAELEREAEVAAGDHDVASALSANAAMRCAGCGAKVGADVLARALARSVSAKRDGVLIGLEAPDDAAVVAPPPDRVIVQSVDFFRALVDDPWELGQIAAEHALGDLYAMAAQPWTALAIATLPFARDDKLEALLSVLLSGASLALDRAGATLVGGHTSEGAELAIGFAVTGLAEKDALLRKSNLSPGDDLVLVKPLGTGTLFAAHMRGE